MSNHPLAPAFTPDIAKIKMGDTPQWKNFALRIQHHPFIKEQLRIKQEGKCPVCSMPVTTSDVVHHVSYLARCKTDSVIDVLNPTQKRPSRTNAAPPCEGCSERTRCISLLVLVHNRCHFLIHKQAS